MKNSTVYQFRLSAATDMEMLLTKYYFFILLSVVYSVTIEKLNDNTLVQLKEGKIRGHILKSGSGKDYYAFQEIPYAAPPVGKNRLKLAKKVDSWKGVLNTTKNTKICYQSTTTYSNPKMSEDCLYINVYTPVRPRSKSNKLPVVFWIHGGSFFEDSGAYQHYGPKYIMDYGIVVVTINYRLGPFGFATTDDEEIPGNIGLKDIVFALEWVSRNIHLFAGDAKQVTIAGESAGALAVGYLLLGQWNNERELFRAGIMQSGSPLFALFNVTQKNARENAFNCGRTLDKNFVSNDSKDLLRVLQEASAPDYLKACGGAIGVIIEEGGDFSYAPLQSLMDGQFKKVPVFIGFNSEEFLMLATSPDISQLVLLDNDPGQLIPAAINISPENRSIAGQLMKKLYTEDSFERNISAYCRWVSDQMTTPVCKHTELMSSQVPVFFYQFSYHGDLGQGQTITIPGAGRVQHGEELHYLWDDGSNSHLCKFPAKDRLTLYRFIKMWTNFVKYQNPTPENDPLLNGVRWLTTESETLRYLNINDTLKIEENPRQYKDVKKILDRYNQPPFSYY